MQFLIVLLSLFSSAYAQPSSKVILKCRLAKLVDYHIFDEGISKDEYPNLQVEEKDGKKIITIGGDLYFTDKTSRVLSFRPNRLSDTYRYQIQYFKSEMNYESYEISGNQNFAELYVLRRQKHLVASYQCSPNYRLRW